MERESLTIGALAHRGGVNVETVRYYQRRGLLAVPVRPSGGIRRYPSETLQRLRFIKRAQQLGFTLREVAELLTIAGGASCSSKCEGHRAKDCGLDQHATRTGPPCRRLPVRRPRRVAVPGDRGARLVRVKPLATAGLFAATAIAEIVGCYLPYLWLKGRAPIWVLIPAAASLAVFVWLLTLHPTAAGRVYAAYGGVYVATAMAWLWLVDGVRPSTWDIVGSLVAVSGMAIIMFGTRP